MSSAASDQAEKANAAASTYGSNAASAYGAASGDIGTYLSNVNSELSAGNPFESKDYLTKQNLETSGAMNSENTAEKQAEQQNVARTGTNSAALANTIASSARQGQRDLTQYNAARDTSNENTWLQQQDKLLSDEATGAGLESNLYSTSANAQNSALSTAQQGADAEENATNGIFSSALTGAGAAAGGYLSRCWIAAELYGGWHEPRTVLVRKWVANDLPTTRTGRMLHWAYGKWGERMAIHIRTHRFTRLVMQYIFDKALSAARSKYESK